MSIFDRLGDRLGERVGALLDDVRLPERLDRRLRDAESALATGDAPAALALVREVEAERPDVWRVLVVAALAYEASGDLAAATTRLTRAVEQRDTALVRASLGRVAMRQGDLRSAREHFERGLERRPDPEDRAELWASLADVYEALGRRARAIPALRQLVRESPGDPALRVRLANALVDDGDREGALAALEPSLDETPPAIDALLRYGALRLAGAPEDEALADAKYAFRRVLEVAADHPRALEGLARVAALERRYADALPLLQQALCSAPLEAQARLHRRVGMAYAASGDAARALDALRASLGLDEEDAVANREAARLALEVGSAEEALRFAERALALDPSDRSARASLGRAQLAGGEVDEARRTLSALRAARMDPEVLHALGALALATGDAIEAIALLREASVRDSNRPGLDGALAEASALLAPALPSLPAVEHLGPQALAPFLDALGQAVATHPLLSDLVPRTTALRQHLDTPLTVAVLGEFNAGKSTLINAFVGEPMLAMGVLPTTSHVNVIRYGPRKVARWTKHDGSVEELPFSEAAALVRRSPEEIQTLEFCFPHPDLRSIHFWDTPGFNAPDDAHEARASEALARADAVVWMLDVSQALSASEFSRLDGVPNPDEKLLIVVNKVDRISDDAEAREAIRDHIVAHVEERLAGLFFLSARDALAAREEAPGDGPPEAGGWSSFHDALQTKVFDRAGRLKTLEVVTQLKALLDEALARTSQALEDLRAASESIRSARRAVLERGARWGNEVSRARLESATRAVLDVRTRGMLEVAQLATPRPGLFARPQLLEDDRAMLSGQLVDRAEAGYARVAQEVLGEVDGLDAAVVGEVERVASKLAPADARTLRRRLEAYLAETTALRRLLLERSVARPTAEIRARVASLGAVVLERLGRDPGRTEAERASHLLALLPSPDAGYAAMLDEWGEEYLSAARRLSDRVERDLDILALDFEQRILRPFEAVRTVLDSTDP